MLQKIYFMVFERYIPELKKYDSISFLHQPMASGQPLKIVQRHMAHPVHTAGAPPRIGKNLSQLRPPYHRGALPVLPPHSILQNKG